MRFLAALALIAVLAGCNRIIVVQLSYAPVKGGTIAYDGPKGREMADDKARAFCGGDFELNQIAQDYKRHAMSMTFTCKGPPTSG